jgi:hypothetical protein
MNNDLQVSVIEDIKLRREKSRGKLWKRLRSTTECNARERRRRKLFFLTCGIP